MLDNVASPASQAEALEAGANLLQAFFDVCPPDNGRSNVVSFFMALLSFRGFDTPSLPAQGEQRLPLIFNIQRGNALEKSVSAPPYALQSLRINRLSQRLGKLARPVR